MPYYPGNGINIVAEPLRFVPRGDLSALRAAKLGNIFLVNLTQNFFSAAHSSRVLNH